MKDLNFVHVTVKSLLPKIDEIQFNAKKTNTLVIRISESKLSFSNLHSKIETDSYDIIRQGSSRNRGRVVCLSC